MFGTIESRQQWMESHPALGGFGFAAAFMVPGVVFLWALGVPAVGLASSRSAQPTRWCASTRSTSSIGRPTRWMRFTGAYRHSTEATIEWRFTNGMAESNDAAVGRIRANVRGFHDPQACIR